MNISELIIDNELQMPSSVSFDSITTSGNIGIGTTNPEAKLEVNGAVHISGGTAEYYGTNVDSSNTTNTYISFGQAGTSNDWAYLRQIGGENVYTMALDLHDDSNNGAFLIRSIESTANPDNVITRFCVDHTGNVGIGTTTPYAKLHIDGSGTGSVRATSHNNWFSWSDGTTMNDAYLTLGPSDASIYATGRISTSSAFHAWSANFSDKRIKENIIDVQDDSCLQKIRLIRPKQYTYKDIISRGTAPVWGFIAQEVSEVLDYAVEKIQKAIPNVYKIASVSEDGTILTFEEPVSLEVGKIQLKTLITEEHDVEVTEVISTKKVRLSLPLSEKHHTGTMGDQNVVRKVFVYGQWVDDFYVLKKDAIFTVAVAALQEVDRRQVEDNERILELEGEVNLLKEENNLLKQQLASITERLTQAGI
jgi:hypothetical protein